MSAETRAATRAGSSLKTGTTTAVRGTPRNDSLSVIKGHATGLRAESVTGSRPVMYSTNPITAVQNGMTTQPKVGAKSARITNSRSVYPCADTMPAIMNVPASVVAPTRPNIMLP